MSLHEVHALSCRPFVDVNATIVAFYIPYNEKNVSFIVKKIDKSIGEHDGTFWPEPSMYADKTPMSIAIIYIVVPTS
jgi:hypothetical protein